jgi:hypothetical protein
LENQHLAGEVAAADSKVRAFAPALVDAVENRFRVQEVEFVVGLISCTCQILIITPPTPVHTSSRLVLLSSRF